MICWICNKNLDDDYIMFPSDDNYIGIEISIFKKSIIIKDIYPFQFLYFTCCYKCINDIIKYKYSSNLLKYIQCREIGKIYKT